MVRYTPKLPQLFNDKKIVTISANGKKRCNQLQWKKRLRHSARQSLSIRVVFQRAIKSISFLPTRFVLFIL